MALLAWDDVTWPKFVAGLRGYRDEFSTERGNRAYVRCVDLIQALPPPERAACAADLVALLNGWACRLSSAHAPGALEQWIRDHVPLLEEIDALIVMDVRVPDHAEELGALHDDLIRQMRANGVRNMSDAAASKALHMLVPSLFVMWDKEIRRSAPEGYGSYLSQMHALARRLAREAPVAPEDIEAHLQDLLGYEARKTLAKYLDEYNWFEAVGRGQLAVKDGRRGRSRAAPG